jgi:hypothetical protein
MLRYGSAIEIRCLAGLRSLNAPFFVIGLQSGRTPRWPQRAHTMRAERADGKSSVRWSGFMMVLWLQLMASQLDEKIAAAVRAHVAQRYRLLLGHRPQSSSASRFTAG